MRPEGLEPPAYWFEASRSIQLSYGRMASSYHPNEHRFTMAVETEIKLRLSEGPERAKAFLKQRGFLAIGPRAARNQPDLRSAQQRVETKRPSAAGALGGRAVDSDI